MLSTPEPEDDDEPVVAPEPPQAVSPAAARSEAATTAIVLDVRMYPSLESVTRG
jgi:hypothetical protein